MANDARKVRENEVCAVRGEGERAHEARSQRPTFAASYGAWFVTGIGRLTFAVAASLMLCFGCIQEEPEEPPNLDQAEDALSALGSSILGFESPTTQWSSQQTSVAQSTITTQGSKSLSFYLRGWTQLRSANIDTLGNVTGQLTYDVFLPATFSWGDTRVVLNSPTLSLSDRDVGGVSLQGKAGGQFHTISLTLPSDVITKLRQTYTDLQVKISINGPTNFPNPVLVDNMVFAGASSGGGGGTNPNVYQLTLQYPQGVERDRILLSGTSSVTFRERVQLSTISRRTNIAGLGSAGVVFSGAAAIGHTDIYARGPVSLSSQTEINGFIRTESATVTYQDNSVVVRGDVQKSTPVPVNTFGWQIEFPTAVTTVPPLNAGSITLAPGAYDQIRANGGQVHLSTGIYYLTDFVTESGSTVFADTTNGPVIIYVKNTWTYRGPIVNVGGQEGKLLVGWLGTTQAPMEVPFVGTAVAPNGKLELRRPTAGQHKGSFFGKHVEVFSDCQLIPLPFDWGTLPDGPPDPDDDGLPWPYDACPFDGTKTQPLICGCGEPETDSDTDGTPDCIEVCDLDPNNTAFGTCGCAGTPNVKPAGTPCSPEGCSGRMDIAGTCDGAGKCVGTSPAGQCLPQVPGVPNGQGTCVEKDYKHGHYVFCTGTVNWTQAEAACRTEPGRYLARIDSQSEGQWLAKQLPSAYWVGGNDITTEGKWYWSGPTNREGRQFWEGGVDGERVDTHIVNWAPQHPGTADCLSLVVGGTWQATDCGTVSGFICEQPKRFPLPPRDDDACDFFPEGCDEPDPDDTFTTEAETPTTTTGASPHSWIAVSEAAASGGQARRASPDNGTTRNTGFESNSPRLSYNVTFPVGGTYQVWIRGRAGGTTVDTSDSVHVGLNGAGQSTSDRITGFTASYGWSHATIDGPVATLSVPSAGAHVVNVWMREDGFVFDKMVLTTRTDFTPTGTGPTPGWEGGDDDDEDPPGPCVDIGTQGFPGGANEEARQLAAAAVQEACMTQCQSPADMPCSECVGFAAVPTGACDDFSSEERRLCMINTEDPSFDPAQACTTSADCAGDEKCGKFNECAVPEASGNLVPCTTDADCGVDQFCGHTAPYCMVNGIRSPCDTRDDDDNCVARCFDGQTCGKVHPDCAVNEETELNALCSEVELCAPDVISVPANLMTNPNTNLTPQVFDESDFFPEELPPAPQVYESAKPEGCGGHDEPPCEFEIGQHPWCTYKGELKKPDEPIEISDDSDAFGDKRGQGGNDLLSFDFDPNLDLNYDLLNFDPLGDGDFDLSAEASAKASAKFNLLSVSGTVNIVDAKARVAAARCGFEGEAYLKLFGLDFLPAVTCGDPFAGLEEFETSGEFATECSASQEEMLELLNRAKKALRDAQELIRQFQNLEEEGMRFVNDLCDKLLGSRDLPPAFEFEGCEGVTPEQVIGYYVNYYRHEVATLVEHYEKMLYEETAGRLPRFDFPIYLGESPSSAPTGSECDDEPSRETQQIVNVNFAIGPIPMNLTIEAFLEYGVNGELLFSLDTSAVAKALLPAAGQPDGKNELAGATLTVTPGASAGVIMFVGAGFDAGPVAAKIGIQGEIILADVGLPAYGGVSLLLESVVDERPPPEDFLGIMPSHTLLFPSKLPQKIRFNAGYRFGMEARITDLLHGTIYGTVRIKFFFFSKTWKKKILEFNSPFSNPDPIVLIQGADSMTLAEADTPLAMFQIPVPFPDVGEILGIELPPYDPNQFDGIRSLQMEEEDPEDPRYADFDPSRVGQLLYDGYCVEEPDTCAEEGDTCEEDADCCGLTGYVRREGDGVVAVPPHWDGVPILNPILLGEGVRVTLEGQRICTGPNSESAQWTCEDCASQGDSCDTTEDCCNDGYDELMCYSDPNAPQYKSCQPCRGNGVLAVPDADSDGDGVVDGGCCDGLIIVDLPNAPPTCSYCKGDYGTCAENADCCGGRTCQANGQCSVIIR